MVRLKSFQFFYWLVVITFVSLLGLVTFIRPLATRQELQNMDFFNESVLSNGQNESHSSETNVSTTKSSEMTEAKVDVTTTLKPMSNILKRQGKKATKIENSKAEDKVDSVPSLVKEDYTSRLSFNLKIANRD